MIRILLGIVFILGVSGCATTPHKTDNDQVQARIVELEKKLEEKDSEIVDLQYEVKDLSSKIEAKAAPQPTAEMSAPVPVLPVAKGHGSETVIRVNATPEQLQTALKSAGVYNGKIDGKIGAGTKASIIEFQKSHGLAADGVVGRKTWEALKAYSSPQ